MAKLAPADLRYERKFLTTSLSSEQMVLQLMLNTHGFRETFPARFVNSIYFDNFDLRNAQDSIYGNAKRTKVRIRWYGDLQGQIREPVLEFKHKRGLSGYKDRYTISPFEIGRRIVRDELDASLATSELPYNVSEVMHAVHPSLVCRYRRRYFEIAGGALRATVDEMLCYHPAGGQSDVLEHGVKDYRSVILELKYDPKIEDLTPAITNQFSFRLSKSSKYVMGIQRLRGGY